jgi:bifunctional ADP-heptose synthase (sugar kinase/adenylyltransferase)
VGREQVEGWGGSVHSLHMLAGYSTSQLIERIRKLPEA